MTTLVISPVASLSLPLTSSPSTFPADLTGIKARIVRVWSNRQFHVAIGGGATTDDMPFAADGDGTLIHLDPGEALTAIKGDDEPDGAIWFSTVARH